MSRSKSVQRLLAFRKIALVPWAVSCCILVIFISPIIIVRFGRLRVERIAHLAMEPELYLCERDSLGGRQSVRRRFLDIFYHTGPPCNFQLFKMWHRVLPRILGRRWGLFVEYTVALLALHPLGRRHIFSWHSHDDPRELLSNFSPHINFTRDEHQQAQARLVEMGVFGDYVCFINRGPEYLRKQFPGQNWTYHDYRDSDIDDYLIAAKALADRGLWALRMGAIVEQSLPDSGPGVIDYAIHYRSEFMDVFLSATCKFMITSTSGLYGIARIFNRPLVVANLTPLCSYMFLGQGAIFVPKMATLKGNASLLPFSHLAAQRPDLCLDPTVELANADPEDIRDAALEMDMRLNGSWEETPEDQELQHRFWRIVGDPSIHRPTNVRVSTLFLRRHAFMLN